MQARGCRHLPVVEEGTVIGMLSLRDLLKVEIDEKNETIMWMNAYIHDVPPDRAR
jgi:CBS domain-containing protein